MNRFTLAGLFLTATLPVAHADVFEQDILGTPYVDMAVGTAGFEESSVKATGYQLTLGTFLTPNFGIEGTFKMAQATENASYTLDYGVTCSNAKLRHAMLGGGLVGRISPLEKLSLTARGGYSLTHKSVDCANQTSYSSSARSGLYVGVGVGYQFAQNWMAELRHDRNNGPFDSHLTSLGLSYTIR